MTYRLASTFAEDTTRREHRVVIVGCGGTGAFVSEGLCRLFMGRSDIHMVLVDHDTVSERNLLRQNFYAEDVGRFKAEALAQRFAKQFERPVSYSLNPLGLSSRRSGMYTAPSLVITCVDNAIARQAAASWASQHMGWWLDVGNGKNWGQVLIGNAGAIEIVKNGRFSHLSGWFSEKTSVCRYLPLPHIQQPELLVPRREEGLDPDCAEAVALGEQSPVINKAMATLVMEFVRRLVAGELTWMQARIDLDSFMLRAVDATPEHVARILKIKPQSLVSKE